VKYGIYCGKMLPLFPVQPPSATSAGGMDWTDYTGFKNRNGGKLSWTESGNQCILTAGSCLRASLSPIQGALIICQGGSDKRQKGPYRDVCTLKAFNILKRQYGLNFRNVLPFEDII
jgi:hypothetical protein